MQPVMPLDPTSRLSSSRLRVFQGKQPIKILIAARHKLPRLSEDKSPQTGRGEGSQRESTVHHQHHIKPNNHKYAHGAGLDHSSLNVRFSLITGSSESVKTTKHSQTPVPTAIPAPIGPVFTKTVPATLAKYKETPDFGFSLQEVTESKLFELRHWILHKIKLKLMNHPFFSLREFDNDKANPQTPNPEPQRKPKIQLVPSHEIVDDSHSHEAESKFSPEHQAAIHRLLGFPPNTQSEVAVHECVRVACEQGKAAELFESRQGNELMQELLQHSELFCKHLTEFCLDNLWSLINDEMKTKTLYVLAKMSAHFRISLFRWFSEHFEAVLGSTASVFLLISAFKVSGSAAEFGQISRLILSRGLEPDTLEHKNFKRFMITYCEFCGEAELEQVSQMLEVKKRIFDWLGDKYEALILSSFIRRKQSEIYNTFLSLLRFNLKDLFQTKFFKSLFFRLSRSPTPADVIGQLNAALLGVPGDQYCEMQRSDCQFLFYVAMFVMTASLHQCPSLAAIAASIDSPDDLLQVFDRLPVPLHNIIRR